MPSWRLLPQLHPRFLSFLMPDGLAGSPLSLLCVTAALGLILPDRGLAEETSQALASSIAPVADPPEQTEAHPSRERQDGAAPATSMSPARGPREGLSLRAAVEMALRNNRNLAKAALSREVQRFDLRVAEDIFVPDVDVTTSTSYNPVRSDGVRTETESAALSVSGRQRLPTGGRVAVVWDNFRTDRSASTGGADYDSSLYLQFDQPLLRGGGFKPNLAALRIARLGERGSVLSFRRTVMDMVTDVVFAYRRLLQAKLQLEVADAAVLRAREQLRINRALVDSGNLAPVEIIQTEADIASQEFNLLTARSALESARYALIRLLDVDRDAALDPTDAVSLPEFTLALPDAQRIAYANRPDYLQLQHNLAIAGIAVDVAKNNRLWSLSLGSRYLVTGEGGGFSSAVDRSLSRDDEDWAVGVTLSIPFGDLSRRQSFLRARSNELQAGIDLAEARDSIDIELRDAFRTLELSRQRVRVAAVARELASSKLDIEKAKLQTGLTTNFAIVTFQNDLVRARLNEISAQIAHLNALTELDRTLGITLSAWGIYIVDIEDGGPPRTTFTPPEPGKTAEP